MTASVLGAFVRRDWDITRSYRLQFVLEITGLVFQLALFFYLGRIVDRADFGDVSGISGSYFSYVVLGLALYNVLTVALTSVSSTLRTEQTTGSLEALLTTPQPGALLITASSSYGYIRSVINMLLYISLAVALFGLRFHLDPWSLLAAFVALIAGMLLFGALGIIVAAVTLVFKRSTAFLGLITSSIALLGGVYFPAAVLPEPLRTLAGLLPVTWALSTIRQALLDGTVDLQRLVVLVVTTGLLLPLAVWLLNAGLTKARKDGTLAQY